MSLLVSELLKRLINTPGDFTPENAFELTNLIMTNNATMAQIGAYLTALKLSKKDHDPNYVAHVARSLRLNAVPVHLQTLSGTDYICDIVGTGGDGQDTFNVSTASSLVAAGAGVKVAKHGNRASSSQCGSADVLEALGCNLTAVTPASIPKFLEDGNFCFLFAQKFHPAMKSVSLPRKELGVRTIFNLLGPMCNPALPQRMVVGVYSKEIGELMANSLLLSGVESGLVVCGAMGLDEISPSGDTHCWKFKSSPHLIEYSVLTPETFGLKPHPFSAVKGGDSKFNSKIMLDLLENRLPDEGSAVLDFVLLNSAALIYTSGKAGSFVEGVKLARESLKSGNALKSFNVFMEGTKKLAA